VDHLLTVQVVQRAAQRVHHLGGILFGVVADLNDFVKELAAGDELHDEVHLFRLVEDLDELDHVRVVHQTHDLNLTLNVAHVLNLAFVVDLHSIDSVLVGLRRALLDDGEIAGAEGAFVDVVLFQNL